MRVGPSAMANCSTFLQVLFRCLFVFAIFFVCLPRSSDGNAELENTLRCAMSGNFDRKCTLSGPELNPHLIELLKRSPSQFRDVLKNPNADLKATLVGKIPLSLVYLLPAEVWSRVDPNVASELVKSHKWNEAIALSVTRGYSAASPSDKSTFLGMVDFSSFERSVVSVMASEISSNWNMDKETLLSLTSSSFFVALPEWYVLEIERSLQVEMLNQIVNWDSGLGLSKEKWFELPAITKRVWTIVSRNYSWNGPEKKSTTPLLAGATPSELQHEAKLFSEYELMQLPLKNRLQVRALVPIVRPEEKLTRFDLPLLKNWFHLLSPDQITRFREDLEFMNIVTEKHLEWSSHTLTRRPFGAPSVPTLRQVIEMTTLVNNERQLLPLDPKLWGDDIAIFGPLTYLIGARRLGHLNDNHAPLLLHTLREIDSPHFSKRMARHLMFKSQDILKVKGLLKGVSTGHLYRFVVSQPESEMDNWREIVRNIPTDDDPARLALVFRKIRENLGIFNNLEAILRNLNCGQFLLLLTFEETTTLYKSLAYHWSRITSENLADKIPQMPDFVLENLLSSPKKSKLELSQSARLETKAFAGLTCERLLALDITNVPDMIVAMRHARKKAGKTDMSKRLQRCARIAVDKYLIERASSTFDSRKAVLDLTISAINPVDVENFGGFVLSTFPPNEIVKNPHAKMIMKKIGSLSAAELVSAVPCYKCLRSMAETAVKVLDAEQNVTFSHLLDLGSLVGFLPAKTILMIYPAHWRILAEAAALDVSTQPICADKESRSSWESIIRSAFGAPEEWKADTLAAIGGYMPALMENTLQSVSLDEVAAAGDTMPLTSGALYLENVEFIGYDHPRPFWKACRDLLAKEERKDYETSVNIAARFQLQGAQLFAAKVKSSDMLKEQRVRHRLTSQSVTTTEAPRDLNKQSSSENPITTTSSMNLNSPWFFWQSKFPSAEVRTPKPSEEKRTTPKPIAEKKLEISGDIKDFISSFHIGEVTTTEGAVAYTLPSFEMTVTASVSDLEATTMASVDFIRQQHESMDKQLISPSDFSSQIVVDGENETGPKVDDTLDPAVGLKQKLEDFSDRPVVASASKPLPETNGTVLSLKELPKELPERATKEPGGKGDETTEPSTAVNDVMLVFTPSNINVTKGFAAVTIPPTASQSSPTQTPVTSSKPSGDNPALISYPSGDNPALISNTSGDNPALISNTSGDNPALISNPGLVRRRRDVDVQAFKIRLTCDGLLTMGPAASLALSSADVDLPYIEFEECIEFLGSLELPKEVARAFWNKLNKESYWKTIEDVGCLVAGMTNEDIDALNLDISSDHFLDTISVISKYADKDVVKTMISKLNVQLDAEISNKGKVALAEEIVLALGQDVCYFPEDLRSHLVNTPNVLLRSLSGMNRDGFFERTPCHPKCLQDLFEALVNQNKTERWTSDDIRNAGVLVAGFPEEELKKISSSKTSKPLGEISAAAARCLSENQLKAMDVESLVWWSSLAAGALSEDQLRTLSAEQRNAVESAIFGRPGVSSAEEAVITSRGAASAITVHLLVLPALLVLTWYFLAQVLYA